MDTKELNAHRRAALFNVKARNLKFNDFFSYDAKRHKDLEIEREKLAIVMTNKAGITEVDSFLEKVRKRKGEIK